MTDEEAIDHALSAVEAAATDQWLMKRNGRPFLALPARRLAALHALRLYQPQRLKARWFISLMQPVVLAGLHRWVLPRFRHAGGMALLEPEFAGCFPGTAGVMLGSPEHRVRRAILSYMTENGWEVAKIAFGVEGAGVLEPEAEVLALLAGKANGVPRLLGLHRSADATMLRMPYMTGKQLRPGESTDALALLDGWISQAEAKPIQSFTEWPAINSALGNSKEGKRALTWLSKMRLRPVIRHGDFARWNLLRQPDGSLIALDWEWGHPAGMPGLDLVHLFLQDARLVERLAPGDAIAKTRDLLKLPACVAYLSRTGWNDDPILPIIASLAWKQGAGHQQNTEVLEAALRAR